MSDCNYSRMGWILTIRKGEGKDTAGEADGDLPFCAK